MIEIITTFIIGVVVGSVFTAVWFYLSESGNIYDNGYHQGYREGYLKRNDVENKRQNNNYN